MTTNIHFRTANIEDATRIQMLVQDAFRAEDSRKDWVGIASLAETFTISLDSVKSKITNDDSEILMAFDGNDNFVGSVEVTQRGDVGRLSMLAVDPRQHRGGLGRQVLSHVIRLQKRLRDLQDAFERDNCRISSHEPLLRRSDPESLLLPLCIPPNS